MGKVIKFNGNNILEPNAKYDRIKHGSTNLILIEFNIVGYVFHIYIYISLEAIECIIDTLT